MQQIIREIVHALGLGKTGALITVIESKGSSPRGAGAAMFVLPDGVAVGTIGGGALEAAAIKRGAELVKSGLDALETFSLSNEAAGNLGMVCGGSVTVLFEPVAPGSMAAAAMRKLSEHLSLFESRTLKRVVHEGRVVDCAVEDRRILRPQMTGDLSSFTFAEPVGPVGRALVFGGGHVSKALAPVLHSVGFSVTVLEDRAEFATRERFPAADCLLVGDYGALIQGLSINEADFVIVMTRGHESDYAILAEILKTGAGYIGCIGSRRKVAVTRERLLGDGYSEEDFARIHAPIGLPIGAETPEEIAVSIAAELIQHRSGTAAR